MIKLFCTLLLFPLLLFSQVTTIGLNKYVDNNGKNTLTEFKNFHNTSIKFDPDIDFIVDDMLEYSDDTNQVGLSIINYSMIIISNRTDQYYNYSTKDIKPRKLSKIKSNATFVRGVLIHEVCHFYIKYLIDSIKNCEYYKKEYESRSSSSKSIEEGICEYSVIQMNEKIVKEYYKPKTLKDLKNIKNQYKINYDYSSYFVKPILDSFGFTNGISIILQHSPPTDEELLNPELYYKRLKTF